MTLYWPVGTGLGGGTAVERLVTTQQQTAGELTQKYSQILECCVCQLEDLSSLLWLSSVDTTKSIQAEEIEYNPSAHCRVALLQHSFRFDKL